MRLGIYIWRSRHWSIIIIEMGNNAHNWLYGVNHKSICSHKPMPSIYLGKWYSHPRHAIHMPFTCHLSPSLSHISFPQVIELIAFYVLHLKKICIDKVETGFVGARTQWVLQLTHTKIFFGSPERWMVTWLREGVGREQYAWGANIIYLDSRQVRLVVERTGLPVHSALLNHDTGEFVV